MNEKEAAIVSASKAALNKQIRDLHEELVARTQLVVALVEHTRPEGHDGPWWPLESVDPPNWFWADYA